MLTTDLFVLAFARMYQLSHASLWQTGAPLSPPTWPAPAVTAKEKAATNTDAKVQSVTNQTTHLVSALQQMTQAIHNSQSNRTRTATTTVHQPHTATHHGNTQSVVNGDHSAAYYSAITQLSKPVTTTQNHWGTAPNSVTPSASLTNQTTTSSQQSAQTTVTVSPTIHLQATIREQADLDDLVSKLNRMLEEEIAISAERAYP